MSVTQLPGQVGYKAARVSSLDYRALGKLTDTNHLSSLRQMEPTLYDKRIISLYTQTALYSNDFLQMINNTTPFYLDGNTDYWQWDVNVPYMYPTLIDIPVSTSNMSTPGIDGQSFTLVFDRKEFYKNDVITADRRYGQNFVVLQDPTPYAGGWLYTFGLLSSTPGTEYVSSQWLQVGIQYQLIDNMVGEFDQDLSGLPALASKVTMYESLSAAYGVEHTVTKWADERTMKDAKGNPLDIMVYSKYMNNQVGSKEILDLRWEPFVETQMRKKMMDLKVKRAIWGKAGTSRTGGDSAEVKKSVEGIYTKMRKYGNLVQYNRGQFSMNILRNVFGDLFYRRVPMADRRVKIYTNEAGIEVFREAAKKDMLNSGLTIIADQRFIDGSGQHMTVNYAFESVVTLDTGKIDLVHLAELDEPQTNTEYSQNKKSTPLFIVFDVSPEGDGTPKSNVREVRRKAAPSMTWGYIDGRQHHLGFAATQGMQSANKFPGYTIWMEDRSDIFVEDLSRTVIIEEIPQI